jgi:primosomal protein N' (replication factor Y)
VSTPDAWEVALALPVDGSFTYSAPEGVEICFGQAVKVPFGPRSVTGYVLGPATEIPETIRPIERVLDPEPAIDSGQLAFFRWAAGYYRAGLGEMIAASLPVAYRASSRTVHHPTEGGIEALAQEAVPTGPLAILLREVIASPGRTRRGLMRRLTDELDAGEVKRSIQALRRRDWIHVVQEETGGIGAGVTVIELVDPDLEPTGGARMRGVLVRLVESEGAMDLAVLVALEGEGARSAVKRLEAKGLVRRSVREDRTAAAFDCLVDRKPAPTLNAHQEAAVAGVGPKGVYLVHGVTGSGKTEVYLRAAARVLKEGKQVLILVPEIALTPLLTGRVKARFGEQVAVLHSALTPTQRLREWRRIRAGEADIAIGARSALFAPMSRLGLIVVDEEHESSFKQDDGVRYHARDLAVVRAQLAGCPVLLGSATPSLESWQNGQDRRYTVLELPERATPRPLPTIELIDMRGQPRKEPLSDELLTALDKTLGPGPAQAVVLYNRRGFAPVVECPGCGAHYDCPSCGVGMVYHQKLGKIRCHYCGFHRRFQAGCPECGDELSVLGHGTERIEAILRERYPDVGIARLDADTTATKGSLHTILERFRTGETRLLVGTQLVAKGHDFPNVQLAAVVGIDHVLMLPDFRSAERTHSLVTQLAGRAGRGEAPGHVIVQTRHPDHFVFRELAHPSLHGFYAQEARQRRILGYPPFARLVMVRVEGVDRGAAWDHAQHMAAALRRSAEPHAGAVDVMGPTPAPLSRLVGRWRFQIILRGRVVPTFRAWLAKDAPLPRQGHPKGVRVRIDVDPHNLL